MTSENKVVLITGAAGFIGSHLCETLLSLDYKVHAVDNLITGSRSNILNCMSNEAFTFFEKDACTFKPTENVKYSHVFHLASPASPVHYGKFPIRTIEANTIGTTNIAGIAAEHRAKLIYTSTSEVYGDPTVHPQIEEYNGNVDPGCIRSVYDESKRLGETIIHTLVRSGALEYATIVRLFNTYGPNMQLDDGRAVPSFIESCLANKDITVFGDGTQTRSMCYISDTVDALIRCMDYNVKIGPYNIGNPSEITMNQLAQLIKDSCNSSSSIVYYDLPDGDPVRRRPDISKAISVLDWRPIVDLNTGIFKTIEYFKRINIS